MAPRYQQGYKPLQTREVAALDPLTVRFAQHMEDNVNHTIVALSPKLISQTWPGGLAMTGSANYMYVGTWGPFKLPSFYDVISWSVYGTYTNQATWALVSSDAQPSSLAVDSAAARPPGNYDLDGIVMGASPTVGTSKRGLEIRLNNDRETWLTLYCATTNASYTATIYTLDATAEHSPAY